MSRKMHYIDSLVQTHFFTYQVKEQREENEGQNKIVSNTTSQTVSEKMERK